MAERVLITGGEGFLGLHLKKYLTEMGVEHSSLDIHGSPLYRWNITEALPWGIQGYDRVIHLAGLLGTSELFAGVTSAVNVNINGTVNVLEWCRRTGANFTGITMAHVWKNPYETTKLAAERLAEAWGREYGFDVNYVTVYNAFGEYQAHGLTHPQKFFPTFTEAALKGEPMPIWGDGTQVLDPVYAGDVVPLLYENPHNMEGGNGVPVTVQGMAEWIWGYAGEGDPKIEYLPMRPGEHTPTRDPVALNPTTPSALLGRQIKQTIEWYKELWKL